VFNRGNAAQDVFINKSDYSRFLLTTNYYRFIKLPIKLSRFLTLPIDNRDSIFARLEGKMERWVEIFCFCLMPNHFHILLKQLTENGISKFVGQLQNSFTRYFNTKRDRVGALFQGQFKAKRVVTEEQLIHLSSYIHLNPYSSSVVKSIEELKEYRYSSLPNYLFGQRCDFVSRDLIFNFFRNEAAYQKFVFDRANYQRQLEITKHLSFD